MPEPDKAVHPASQPGPTPDDDDWPFPDDDHAVMVPPDGLEPPCPTCRGAIESVVVCRITAAMTAAPCGHPLTPEQLDEVVRHA